MSGIGKRFIDGGYAVPKPLIEIDGKPIIQHVVNLFPGETKFTFICNQIHLETTNMREVLLNAAPAGEIVSIDLHTLGPVYTVSKIMDCIDDDEEVIVNYCDFSTYWDYEIFLSHTRDRDADGVVVCYKGFHPHMLGKTKYATLREEKQWMLEIKEKGSFTNDRMNEYISNGTYYFKKGSYVKKYFEKLMTDKISLNGEYYVSLIYNLLVDDGLKVSIYDIEHMLQWGEPYDFASYRYYSEYFNKIIITKEQWNPRTNSLTLVNLDNNNNLFSDEDYSLAKPLLDVCGIPMAIQAHNQLPCSEQLLYITSDNIVKSTLDSKLNSKNTAVISSAINNNLSETYTSALANVNDEAELLISSCDNGVLWDQNKYQSLLNDESVDVIVWVAKEHPSIISQPSSFSWIKHNENKVVDVFFNDSIYEEAALEYASIGVFTFKNVSLFKLAIKKLTGKNIEDKHYLSNIINILIELGKNVHVFEVDAVSFWDTPADYETFNYWQSYFHKYKDHSYTLNNDAYVDKETADKLGDKFTAFKQTYK